MDPLYLIVRGEKILRKCMETELHQLAFVALTVPQTASKEHHSLKEMQQISLNTQQKYSQETLFTFEHQNLWYESHFPTRNQKFSLMNVKKVQKEKNKLFPSPA